MQSTPKLSNLSLIKPLGYQRKTSCGYCKRHDGSSSYYISCDDLKVEHYQDLIDRGWRRSGTLYYKPDLLRSCCPHYTIRLDGLAFKAKKDKRKALNRWNRYVLGPEYEKKVTQLCPVSREDKRRRRSKFDLFTSLHASEYGQIKRPIDPKTKKPIEPAHKFEVTLESDAFSVEKWNVFLPYQMTVHKEERSRWSHQSFKRFLCSGPNHRIIRSDGKTQKLGSYHQCYRLDGKLIAVGVLDLLPHGVSSVYLFYDPEYEAWELGKLSALREIALAVEGQHRYYYMGYYIHSCIKMRYKVAYSPSFVLDPESLEWCNFDASYRAKLDQSNYVSLSREKKMANGDHSNPSITGEKTAPNNDSQVPNVANETNMPVGANGPAETGVMQPDDYELDSETSDDDAEIPEGSLFDYNIPGVLSLEEVRKLDLDRWKLVVRDMLVDFEDLKTWDDSSMTDPQSIKGIAAELAATIGPEVMQGSAVVLF